MPCFQTKKYLIFGISVISDKELSISYDFAPIDDRREICYII